MTDLFKNKYRIPSARLKDWDYGVRASYFITICTHHRLHYFGKIEKTKMVLSPTGKIALHFWQEIPDHFEHVQLGPFMIMPNHIHAMLTLNNNRRDAIDRVSEDNKTQNSDTINCASKNNDNHNIVKSDVMNHVSTGGVTGDKNPMLNNSVSRIIRWYKGRCTYEIRRFKPNQYFQWQSRFYDHIIRDQKEYDRIHKYIINNPAQWEDDL